MSTTKKSLFVDAFCVSSLKNAWERVRRNDGCAGGDGVSVNAFSQNLHHNLTALSAAILGGTYGPRDLRRLDIAKDDGTLRPLCVPCVSDRIAQTAAARILTPLLEPGFSKYSFAYRPGKSVIQAVRTIENLRSRGFTHVVESDIERCFESIPHDRLLALLEAVIGNQNSRMLDMVGIWLEHYALEMQTPGRGLAQGSPLSPVLANLYLDQLDDVFAKKHLALVRFADDFVILCKSEEAAHSALNQAKSFLRDHGLEMKGDKTRVVDFSRGFEFLGHLFVRSLVVKQVSDNNKDIHSVLREQNQVDIAQFNENAADSMAENVAMAAGFDPGQRVLYLNEEGRRLRRRNLSFVVQDEEGRELIALAHGRVNRIEIGPKGDINLDCIRHALGTDTDLALVDGRGKTLGLLSRPPAKKANLHLAQARIMLDPDKSVALARAIVRARIFNCRTRLHLLNRQEKHASVIHATTALGRCLRKLDRSSSVESLRGHEGAAAAIYWPALGLLCRGIGAGFTRSRPAKDPLNAAINYLTALLSRDIRAAIIARGLHSGFGVLHSARDGHEACVWDLMEGFRAVMSEGVAVALFNQRRLLPDMFAPQGTGVRISTKGRAALITGYEAACSRVAKSPHSGRRCKMRRLMDEEAGALAKFCRSNGEHEFLPALQDY